MVDSFACLIDSSAFVASFNLKKYFWREKEVTWCGYNILVKAPARGKYHLREETPVWTLTLGGSECSSSPHLLPPSSTSWLFGFPSSHSFHSCPWGLHTVLWLSITPLRRQLEYHTHARKAPIGHFHVDIQPPSRILHFNITPFCFNHESAVCPQTMFLSEVPLPGPLGC